jgi:hypothetical protein
MEAPRGDKPFVKPVASVSEWRFETLALAGTKAIK